MHCDIHTVAGPDAAELRTTKQQPNALAQRE